MSKILAIASVLVVAPGCVIEDYVSATLLDVLLDTVWSVIGGLLPF